MDCSLFQGNLKYYHSLSGHKVASSLLVHIHCLLLLFIITIIYLYIHYYLYTLYSTTRDFHKSTAHCNQPNFPTGFLMCRNRAWASTAQLNQWIRSSSVTNHSIYSSLDTLYCIFYLLLFQDFIC